MSRPISELRRHGQRIRLGGACFRAGCPDRPPHTALVAIQSVYERFDRKDHPTFKFLDLDTQFQVVMSFLAVFARPSSDREKLVDRVTKLNWIHPSAVYNDIPAEVASFFRDYLHHVRAKP
eukprot:1041649_1